MAHERFYVSGTCFVPRCGAYSGWVAHPNSFATANCGIDEHADVALVLAGECFESDVASGDVGGSWLIRRYQEVGDSVFDTLNGLFSGLLIDRRRNRAFLFGDRYGLERIYFHETGDAVYFASEAKALLRVCPQLRRFDPEGVTQFLALGCTMEGRTLFNGVRLLPGGSVWRFQSRGGPKRSRFSPQVLESQPLLSCDAFESQLHSTLARILPRYFGNGSKLGISLTAGLDTRMLMSCRPDLAETPICYTFDGSNGDTLDSRLAARVAEACGYEHHILRVGPDFFSDFESHAARTVSVTDGCFGVTGAHEIYLNRTAREIAPVRLTGAFGGEILRGISTFKPLNLAPDLLDPDLRERVSACANQFVSTRNHPTSFAAFQEIPWSIFGSIAACRSQVTFRAPFLDNDLVALAFRKPERLRGSPGPAVHLVERNAPALNRIPTDMGLLGEGDRLTRICARFVSKAAFKLEYWCNDGLPHWLSPFDSLLERISSGMGILGLHKYLRYRRWFRRELAGYVREASMAASVTQSSFWNGAFVKRIADDHIRGSQNYVREINAVLTLDAVQRLIIQAP